MDKEYFLSAGVHFEPSPVKNWQSLFSSQEMNCSPEQSLDCFLNPTWDKSTDQYANFESALSSKVSSPAASNSAVSNDSFEIPELIGKLATICNSGEISPQSPQSPPSIVVNLNYHRPFFIPQTSLSYSSPAMEKKMENQENKTISEEEPTTAHAIADSSPAQSPSPSPPRDPKPSLPSARSPAESSVSSDLSHRTSLSHGSSPRENPPENVKSPSPQPVVNRFVREEPLAVTKLDPGPGIGDVEGGGSERRTRRSLSILRRVKREKMVKKAALGLRIWGLVFCLISFAVMASDKNKGWALDSFYRYKEFRYCISVNVVGFMYSAVQACDLAYHFSTGNYVVRHQLRYYFDFLMDQSLCNACGIRSRKKIRALLGLKTEHKKSKKTNNHNNGSNTSKLGDSLKRKLLGFGREVVVQRSLVEELRRRRKLGEEEQAAMLSMALACGSV